MNLTTDRLMREAAATGFESEPLEKALRLVALLEALNSHPYLKPRIALKGGTALNLYQLDAPRLSVDIDLNYLGTDDREAMSLERPQLEQAIQAVCSREALAVARVPADHAGGKWRLTYEASHGARGHLELDMNYLLRTPLWPCRRLACRAIGSGTRPLVSVLDVHELAAGKMAALMARTASRDLFDVCQLLSIRDLDPSKLRLAFVVYGAMNREDWRTASIDDVRVDVNDVRTALVPMLRAAVAPARPHITEWSHQLVAECRSLLSAVLPLTDSEREFVRRLNEEGTIAPSLLTSDPGMQSLIQHHPALRWKAINVRKHFGLPQEPQG